MKKFGSKQVSSIVAVFILSYCLYMLFYYFYQRKIIFPIHKRSVPENVLAENPEIESIWFDQDDGKFEAWYLPPLVSTDSSKIPLAVVSHGNLEFIDNYVSRVEGLRNTGIAVLLVEFPGYGRSTGKLSQKSITKAFVTAYDYIISNKTEIDTSRILMFGRSLGGGVIAQLAKRRPSSALIMFTTFKSISAMTQYYFLPGWIARDKFDNLEVIRNYNHPVLVVHGTKDTTVPYEHGLALYKAAKDGTMVTKDCGHDDCTPDWNKFWEEVKPFLLKSGIID